MPFIIQDKISGEYWTIGRSNTESKEHAKILLKESLAQAIADKLQEQNMTNYNREQSWIKHGHKPYEGWEPRRKKSNWHVIEIENTNGENK